MLNKKSEAQEIENCANNLNHTMDRLCLAWKGRKWEEADTLNERRKALENKAERLKSYLSLALDGEKFQTARCSVTFRKTSSVQVSNPEALIRWLEQNGYDAECVKYKEPEVSKTGVGKLIKDGVPVPYAHIEQGRSVGVK